jgi:hypothetical protein
MPTGANTGGHELKYDAVIGTIKARTDDVAKSNPATPDSLSDSLEQ